MNDITKRDREVYKKAMRTVEILDGVEIITLELDRPGYELWGTVFVKKNLTPKKREEVINWGISLIAEREREAKADRY